MRGNVTTRREREGHSGGLGCSTRKVANHPKKKPNKAPCGLWKFHTCPSCVKLCRHQTNGYYYESWAAFSLPFLFNNLLPGRSIFNFTLLYIWCRNCNCDNVVKFWTILHALLVHKTGDSQRCHFWSAGMNTRGQVWILLILIMLVLRNPHKEAIKAVRNINYTKPAVIRAARHSSRVVAPSMLPNKVSPVQW